MRSYLIVLALLLFSGCENPPGAPGPKRSNKGPLSNAYNKMVNTFSSLGRTGKEYTNDLNDVMYGPNGAPNDNCVGEDYGKVTVVGFPLSVATGPAGSIKGEAQVLWDECGGEIKSSYIENGKLTGCKKRKVSKEYIEFFEENFNKCAQDSFVEFEGLSTTEGLSNLKFGHKGIAGDTRHSNRSYHSVNRAIDIAHIDITYNGEPRRFKVSNQNKDPEKKFFDAFRACWDAQIVKNKSGCPGNDPKGSIGHEDKDHKHHMHLSLPYCPSKSGFYIK